MPGKPRHVNLQSLTMLGQPRHVHFSFLHSSRTPRHINCSCMPVPGTAPETYGARHGCIILHQRRSTRKLKFKLPVSAGAAHKASLHAPGLADVPTFVLRRRAAASASPSRVLLQMPAKPPRVLSSAGVAAAEQPSISTSNHAFAVAGAAADACPASAGATSCGSGGGGGGGGGGGMPCIGRGSPASAGAIIASV